MVLCCRPYRKGHGSGYACAVGANGYRTHALRCSRGPDRTPYDPRLRAQGSVWYGSGKRSRGVHRAFVDVAASVPQKKTPATVPLARNGTGVGVGSRELPLLFYETDESTACVDCIFVVVRCDTIFPCTCNCYAITLLSKSSNS